MFVFFHNSLFWKTRLESKDAWGFSTRKEEVNLKQLLGTSKISINNHIGQLLIVSRTEELLLSIVEAVTDVTANRTGGSEVRGDNY